VTSAAAPGSGPTHYVPTPTGLVSSLFGPLTGGTAATLTTSTANAGAGNFRFTFPAHSVTRIELAPAS